MQRRDAAVDARAVRVLADFGVDGEREIQRGGALGEPLDVAARRKDEDLVLIEIDLQELEELLGAVGVLLQLDELAEPRQVAVQRIGRLPARFVQPVRGNAVLGGAVHVASADLDLVQLAPRPEHRRVE